MQDFEKLGKELMGGKNAGAIKEIANSAEGQKLSKMFDAKAVEQAAKSGNTGELQKLLAQVLSTDEGKALADKLSKTMNGK